MRNGNFLVSFFPNTSFYLRSYPTYEEWKLEEYEGVSDIEIGSYPTYEEWKLELKNAKMVNLKCSYPTYEEWKRKQYVNIFSRR